MLADVEERPIEVALRLYGEALVDAEPDGTPWVLSCVGAVRSSTRRPRWAVRQSGRWLVRLLVHYPTSWEGAPGDPCSAQVTRSLVPGETMVIAGCFNGGSDAESFVVVLSFPPNDNLPEVLLSLDCGVTWWRVHRSSLVIESGGLTGGLQDHTKAHPDVTFGWQGMFVPTSPSFDDHGADWPPFCKALSPSFDGT